MHGECASVVKVLSLPLLAEPFGRTIVSGLVPGCVRNQVYIIHNYSNSIKSNLSYITRSI